MSQFRDAFENRHRYAKEWKKQTGGKVLGYFEPYVPEELAYAAGVLPVRLIGSHKQDDISDRYMYGNCRPSRDILVQALDGTYNYIDGTVYAECCQWMRGCFSSWQVHKPTEFSHYVFVPDFAEGHRAKTLLRSELGFFQKALEKWTGKTITNRALDKAIEVYNENRALMRQIFEMRRVENPPLTGTEALDLVLSSQVMDKAEHNKMLAAELKRLGKVKADKPKFRLMVLGSEVHNTGLEEYIDAVGGTVVIDEYDNGSGYFWNEVIPQEDRLMALSLRYLDKPRHPLKDISYARRPERIVEMIEDYHVNGVILMKQKFCHPHGTDFPSIWKILRERQVPFLYIEEDTTIPTVEVKADIDGFIETIVPTALPVK
jgi:benzoyl-CoA reductase subunit C